MLFPVDLVSPFRALRRYAVVLVRSGNMHPMTSLPGRCARELRVEQA
jgi:hypothetical protein